MDSTAAINGREDLSRFLVHLTRDGSNSTAEENLVAMLASQTIEARNAHCLFHRKFDALKFSSTLRKKFFTVCLTEVPFTQLRHLAAEIKGRRIKLKPFGLVFLKSSLLKKGASPAIYLNAKGTKLRDYLIKQFDDHFKTRSKYIELSTEFDDADSIIAYYSLINVISSTYDFSWEREWRISGDYEFGFSDLFAIIAEDPETFLELCRKKLSKKVYNQVRYVPIVSLQWNAERIIEELSRKLWESQP